MTAAPIPVVVVGGGPVGVAAGILLARAGIESVVLERQLAVPDHPKARGLTIRTMELLRQWGIEGEVRRVGPPAETRRGITFCRTISDADYLYTLIEDVATTRSLSPTVGAGCSQYELELVLRAEAHRCGVDLRIGHEVEVVDQHAGGVLVGGTVLGTGARFDFDASYVIGADGPSSLVRRSAGIDYVGPGPLADNLNIRFRAEVLPYVESHPSRLYWIDNAPVVTGVLITVDHQREWLLNVVGPGGEQGGGSVPEPALVGLVRSAIGVDDLDVEIIGAVRWQASALMASAFAAGRLFVAGDAAHVMPPYGGFNMNAGLADVHNLVWKLRAVLAGEAGADLLTTYDTERRPVAAFTLAAARSRMATLGHSKPNVAGDVVTGGRAERVDGVVFGYSYASLAVVPDGTDPPTINDPVAEYEPTGRPGSRAPHLWLDDQAGGRRSTLDLFEHRFVLLAATDAWPLDDARVDVVRIGTDVVDVDGQFASRYGVSTGAVLIRPDGFVAARWPVAVDDPGEAVGAALDHVLARSPAPA